MRRMVLILGGAWLMLSAASWGNSTLSDWSTHPRSVTMLSGAIEVLSWLGLACPGQITLGDIQNDLKARVVADATANFSDVLFAVFYARNCRFHGERLDLILQVMKPGKCSTSRTRRSPRSLVSPVPSPQW